MTLEFVSNISVMFRHARKSTKSLHGQQRYRAIALILLAVVLTTMMLVLYKPKGKPSSASDPLAQLRGSFRPSVRFQPSTELTNGTDVIWQIPDSPKAVLFIAHGCNGRAANFWDSTPGCPNCVGLPEERRIVLQALDRKFAVLTVSSIGKCWSFGKEKETSRWIINWWIRKHKLEKLSVTALGASSGGYFVSALAAEIPFSSIILMIAEGVFHSLDVRSDYPPTLFVHMPKDRDRMKLIQVYMGTLRQKGISVKEVRCMEFPLFPTFLSDRIRGLDERTSIKLFELFHEEGFVDENGYMKNDGRATRWKKALRERKFLLEKLEWLDHIQEELNLAFGYHEMTSLQSNAIFDWFESHLS